MGFYEHATEYNGLGVREYVRGKGLGATPARTAWRIFLEDAYDSKEPLTNVLADFLKEKGVDQVTTLVVGIWESASETGSEGLVEALVAARAHLPSLRALFFGDIMVEECEVSWIIQSDVSPLLAAYPKLEHFRVRGGNSLSLGSLKHGSLRSLIVETGGMSADLVRQVAAADLPALTHLELWLGSENYGADHAIKDLDPILQGKLFPRLESLGLRNSEKADELAAAVVQAPILQRIRVLDLSMGNLGDKGGEILASCDALKKLKKVDLHHHYLSPAVMKKIAALGIPFDLEDRQEGDDEDRYCAVGE